MIKKLVQLLKRDVRSLPIKFIVIAVIAPIIFTAIFSYIFIKDQLNTLIFSRREALAYLSAITVQERLDRLVDLGVSYSSDLKLHEEIKEEKWAEAISRFDTTQLKYIDRVFITDPAGTLMADMPQLSGVQGQNFASRAWYRGVSAEWRPYVSDIYRRTAEPSINVIAVATPIIGEDDKILGILVFQLELNTLLDWMKNIDIESSDHIYFVDRSGNVINNTSSRPGSQILNFSFVPAVQKVLKGESRVETAYNPIESEERLVAYSPIKTYGWGVVVEQPVNEAFALRDQTLRVILIIYATIVFLTLLLLRIALQGIAERNRARALIESEKRFRSLIENSWEAIILSDDKSRIFYASPSTVRVLGYQPEELYGKDGSDMVHMEDREQLKLMATKLVEKNGNSVTTQIRIKHKNGSWIWIESNITNMLQEPNIKAFVSNFRDITEQKLLEQMKSDFFWMATHQLRTPLSSVRWNIELLLSSQTEKISEKIKLKLSKIQDSTERMINQVKEILAVSRMQTYQIKGKSEKIDVADTVEEALIDLDSLANKRNVNVRIKKNDSMPQSIIIDKQRFEDIIQNLVMNAIKYNKDGGDVTVTLGGTQSILDISVADKGIGIPIEDKDKIFTRFFRATNVSNAEGTGLGLALIKLYIEQHNGKIWFDSEENIGTTFYVQLPVNGLNT